MLNRRFVFVVVSDVVVALIVIVVLDVSSSYSVVFVVFVFTVPLYSSACSLTFAVILVLLFILLLHRLRCLRRYSSPYSLLYSTYLSYPLSVSSLILLSSLSFLLAPSPTCYLCRLLSLRFVSNNLRLLWITTYI